MNIRHEQLMGESAFLRDHATSFLDAPPFRIHYLRAGKGEPLILIHGGGVWLYSFRHNMLPLSESFSVSALDMPGYGFTSLMQGYTPMGLETMVQAVKAFMDGMGIPRSSILGHSWGGGWALAFAQTYPDMIDRIILIDSSGLDVRDIPEWEFLKLPAIGRILLRALTPGLVRRRLERSFFRRDCVDETMAREVCLPLKLPANRKAQARLSRRVSWKETERRLKDIAQPVLLIWGDHDRYLDVSLAEGFRRHIKDIRVEIVGQCGHSAHEERPETVNRLIIDFLSNSS